MPQSLFDSLPPELKFQQHIADFLTREHGYSVLGQTEITDTQNIIAEDHLWAFLNETQSDTLTKLAEEYGTDARDEVFKALRSELKYMPLWLLLRNGLEVRGLKFRLYYAKPRSAESAGGKHYAKNSITFRPHFYYGQTHNEIDFVLFLNGLPIVALELKHEKNQTVHDAVAQFVARDHSHKVFQHPFLYLAADTTDVMAATDPRREANFRWHNTGLTNAPQTDGEYPIEFLYREVLSKERLLETLAFFLVYVPHRPAVEDRPERPAFTLLPRYHQSRMVRRVAEDASAYFSATGTVGRKYLINHSAGSGKTLSICWLADRLHSLYDSVTNEKIVNVVFILTDRKSLDKNINDEIENFAHLKDVVGIAKKADDLPRFLKEKKPIIVTTQQKFALVLDEIEKNEELKTWRVAFLIDEAHRSQDGKQGAAIKKPFRVSELDGDTSNGGASGSIAVKGEVVSASITDINFDDSDEAEQVAAPDVVPADAADAEEGVDEEEEVARIIREHDHNQLFVAFTATPAPATVTLFGSPFDTYSEAEAITEGYILDVAANIISYKTLYHLHCRFVPKVEKLYPAGVIAKALKDVAYADDGLIQYKAEVMLRLFEERIKPLIEGRAKAMIVASSRVAGLRYFEIIKEKLKERGADYKVLYAFSDFVNPQTHEAVSEHGINELAEGELIEDRFEGDDYPLMVVANKFQTGFDQPLLAGMFLDKAVADRNAVQTVSRLNRCHDGKKDVVVVDFTNNAELILKAFAKYREGTPFEPGEPDAQQCVRLYNEIIKSGVFAQGDATTLVQLIVSSNDPAVQTLVNNLRARFGSIIIDPEERKAFVYLLARFVTSYHFLTNFFSYPAEVGQFAAFAEYVGPQLIKQGTVSELMKHIRETEVIKAAVTYSGEFKMGAPVKTKTGQGGSSAGVPVMRVSVQDVIDSIRAQFDISDEEALYIREVTEEKSKDANIAASVQLHKDDSYYLLGPFKEQVNQQVQAAYIERGRYDEIADPKYIEPGAIFDIMSKTIIDNNLSLPEGAY
jgi:type I restriction enzyme R subunit